MSKNRIVKFYLEHEEKTRIEQARTALKKPQFQYPIREAVQLIFPCVLFGLVAGFVFALILQTPFPMLSIFLGIPIGFLWKLRKEISRYNKECQHLRRMPADERRWHERVIAFYDEIAYFNEKIDAFDGLVETLPEEVIDPAIIEKLARDRAILENRRNLYRREQQLRKRDAKLREFEKVLAKDQSSGFRDTRDLTDMLFAQGIRVALEAEVAGEDGDGVDDAIEEPIEHEPKRLGS